MSGTWYRFTDFQTAPSVDEWDNIVGKGGVNIRLHEYKVAKITPKGVQLDLGWGDKRFVLRDARKRFACPTLEEAKVSFLARKKRQLGIYEARADIVRRVIAKFKKEYGDEDTKKPRAFHPSTDIHH